MLAIMAHPDDAEEFVGGTAALLAWKGWEVHFMSLTRGECGSQSLPAAEIAQIREREARAAAAILGAEYHTLDIHDGCVTVDLTTVRQVVEVIREIHPQLIFTHPSEDYMADHTHTAQLVRWAVAESRHPNFCLARPSIALHERPHFYHVDPEKLFDPDGQITAATTIVDISAVMPQKMAAFAAHESQCKPTSPLQIGTLDQIERCAIIRGHQIGVRYGEGFRQLLLDSYPRTNLLREILPDQVFTL